MHENLNLNRHHQSCLNTKSYGQTVAVTELAEVLAVFYHSNLLFSNFVFKFMIPDLRSDAQNAM